MLDVDRSTKTGGRRRIVEIVRSRVSTAKGDRVKSTYDGLAGRLDEYSRYLVARREDADVLVLRLPDGQTALPVFGCGEEAGMFVWLETTGEEWCVTEISAGDLFALFRGSCAGVGRIVSPFHASGVWKGHASVDREDFLRILSGGWICRDEDAGRTPPDISELGGEDFW